MKQCQHILCVIDPDARGEQVLRLAWEHARRHSAALLTAHVVDYHTGFESDHAPFLSPAELATGLAQAASQRIRAMLEKIHPSGNLWVEVGPAWQTVIGLANECGADLVIVGSHSPFGLQTTQAHTPPHRSHGSSVQVRRSWNPCTIHYWSCRNAATRRRDSCRPPDRGGRRTRFADRSQVGIGGLIVAHRRAGMPVTQVTQLPAVRDRPE
jgi:nucleotide-binding universal stress UspA family protein